MKTKVILNALAFCLCFTLVTKGLHAQTLAFPGAAGFGKHSVGGRGGKIFKVTDLADSNDFVDHGTHWTGTFRAGCESINEPRILVFKVSGTIYIEQNQGVAIKHPFITIAGNTAPGEGVVFRGGPIYVFDHDVIIRHLRHFVDVEKPLDGVDAMNLIVWGKDATNPIYNIIIDHCTTAWTAGDSVGGMQNIYDISWTNNMVAEGLQLTGRDTLSGAS